MENNICKRIELLVTQLSKGPSDFSRKIGYTASTVSSIIGRKSKPGGEVLSKILIAYPQVDALWLVCGIGEMQIHTKKEGGEIVEILKKENEILAKNNDFLLRNQERLWNLVEENGKKIESNEDPQIDNIRQLVVLTKQVA